MFGKLLLAILPCMHLFILNPSITIAYDCNWDSVCDIDCECSRIWSTIGLPTWYFSVKCTNLRTNGTPFFSCLHGNVSRVSLYGCDITSLENGDLDTNKELFSFKIRDCPLNSISSNVFDSTTLRELDIDNSSLTKLESKLFSNVTVITIRVTNSLLTNVSHEFFQGPSKPYMQIVDFTNNRLESIPGGLIYNDTENLLANLYLRGNNLTSVDEFLLQNLDELWNLYLSNNNISSIHENAFHSLTSLRKVELDRNELGSVPITLLSYSPHLETVNISNNKLTSVPQLNVSSILTIDFSGNLLTQINDTSFKGLEQLEILHLSHMPTLTNITNNAFANMNQLIALYLTNNSHLTTLSPQLQLTVELRYLHIQDNGLTVLPKDIFQNLIELYDARAHGNPLHCSCEAAWLRREMDNEYNEWIQPWKSGDTAVRCVTPSNFNGTEVYQFEVYDLTCEDPVLERKNGFEDDKGEIFYLEAILSRGLPTTVWMTPGGINLTGGQSDDPGSGKDLITVQETILANNSIHTRLTITQPTTHSNGVYSMLAENAEGSLLCTFDVELQYDEKKTDVVGIVASAILGTTILVSLILVTVYYIRRRKYNQMNK